MLLLQKLQQKIDCGMNWNEKKGLEKWTIIKGRVRTKTF